MNAARGTMRYWLNLILFSLLAIVLGYFLYAYLGVSYFMARGFTHPERGQLCCITPKDMGYAYEDIALMTSDGLSIQGWYIPSKNEAAVILLHPIGANRMAGINMGAIFANHGYGVLMIDIRAHGESDGEVLSYGGPEIQDVVAAMDYLSARPEVAPGKIGVMGWSLGGGIGLLSAAQDERITAVVADGPGAAVYDDWPKPNTFSDSLYVPFDLMFFFYLHNFDGVDDPVSVKEAMGWIAPRPVLLIGGVSESGGNLDERFVTQYYAAAEEPKEMWVLQDTEHISGLETHPEAYEEKVIGFFDKYLLDK